MKLHATGCGPVFVAVRLQTNCTLCGMLIIDSITFATQVRSVVGFGNSPATIVVASASGVFYTAAFNSQKGGMCEQRSFCRFLEAND